MTNAILIAGGAGIASALLAATAVSGGALGLVISLISPLPLMIVAFGWHPLLAVLGGALTAAALAAFLRGSAGLVYAVLVMAPAYLAGYIVWRGHNPAATVAGQLCIGAAVFGAIAALLGALSISLDYPTMQDHMLKQSELVFRFMMGLAKDAPLTPIRGQDPQLFIRTYAELVAPVSAFMLGLVYLVNIWLAGRIADTSGRLPIERPPAPDMAFPALVLPATVVAILGGMLPGYLGFAAELLAIALILAIIVLGFATLHALTRGNAARSFILSGLWILTLVFGLPALLMLGLGIAELAFGWRARKAAGRNP
jgi:Predicted membrane protein (DUF2232)